MKKILFLTALILSASACCGDRNSKQTSAQTSPEACCAGDLPDFNNADFYTGGDFNAEAAKDAVILLMRYYHYPVAANTRRQLWVSDYGTGRFTELGLAAIMYANDTENLYMLQDLFLLPNQMLPEHWHEKPQGPLPAKMEGWLVRHGSSFIVGEGEDNLPAFPQIAIPDCHAGGVTVKYAVEACEGDFVPLSRVFSHHWQMAGPKGAIITEVANVHANEAVRHQVKAINDFFLGK